MKVSMKIIVVLSLLTFAACGNSVTKSGSSSPTGGITLQDSTGTLIGDVVLVGQNTATVYSSTLGEYLSLNISTGLYNPTQIYYASTGCTGAAAAPYSGVVGKAVVYGNSAYYLTTTATTNFAYQSYWFNGACSNLTSTMSSGALLNSITQPADYSKNVPLTLNFNETKVIYE